MLSWDDDFIFFHSGEYCYDLQCFLDKKILNFQNTFSQSEKFTLVWKIEWVCALFNKYYVIKTYLQNYFWV